MSDELHNMNITRCPYDSTEITIEDYEAGAYMISCHKCGAKWETNNAWVARVAEPDWEIVKEFQAEQTNARESQAQ